MKRTNVRLADVAREAGVSLATVDRAVNGRPGVRKQTLERIWEVVRRLESEAPSLPLGNSVFAPLHFDFVLPAGPNTFMQNLDDMLQAIGSDLESQRISYRCHRIESFNPYALAETVFQLSKTSSGMAIAALDNPVVREAVNEVSDRGVPVVTLVCDLSNARQIGYVGLDNRAAGRTAGYLMGRFTAGRKGSVVLIAGSLGLSYRDHQEREMGFRDAIYEQFPNLEIADRYEDQDNFEKAHEQTNIILDRFPDLLGIYNVGGGSRGIGMALRERGRGGDTVFVGHELTRFTRQFLIDGTMDAVINQDVAHEAMAAYQYLLDFHHRPSPLPRLGQPRVEVYLRENLP